MKRCSADADCRTAEGYFCDATWHACMIPNTAVIVPRQCPAPRTALRDRAFGPAIAVAADASGSQEAPSAIVTDKGDVVAQFETPGGHAQVQLARDRKGIVYAVWLDAEGNHRQISLARSRDGGRTWSEPDKVDDDDCTARDPLCIDRPFLAIPATGDDVIHVLYAASGGIRVSTSHDEGATFRRAVTAMSGHHGSATVSADGRLQVIALDPGTSVLGYGSADHRIVYTVSTDGGATFAAAHKLSGRDEILSAYAATPAIAVDTKRNYTYAAYVRGGRDAVWDIVVLVSKDKGKTWKRTRIGDAPACAIHMDPQLVVDPVTGTLHVAWYDSLGGGRFAHATCPPGAASCTQWGAINEQPFAALTAEHGTARSLGESASLVIDAKRRVLHAVWTQPVVIDGGAVVSRVFRAQANLPKK
jgi:hypothetical protein